MPVTEATLITSDGVPISAVHEPMEPSNLQRSARDLCFVVVHGFTGNWRQERVQKVVARLRRAGGVVAMDMRGHGRSGGKSTVGDSEVFDVCAAVQWARSLGYGFVVSVGFSLGGGVVLREAGMAASKDLESGVVDAVVSVSAPAFWFYRGTRIMRIVHHVVEHRPGRLALRLKGTRVSGAGWTQPLPIAPYEAVALLGQTPVLIVHGDVDRYFPTEHAHAIYDASMRVGGGAELWLIPGFGHAEAAVPADVVDRIAEWARECAATASR